MAYRYHALRARFGSALLPLLVLLLVAYGTILLAVSINAGADDPVDPPPASRFDLDGDLADEILLPDPYYNTVTPWVGAVHVLSGDDQNLLFSLISTEPNDLFGLGVDAVGDVNGDGVPDIAVGAPWAMVNAIRSGRVTVFSGFDGTALYSIDGPENSEFGRSVSGAPDFNADGVPDFLIGAVHKPVDAGFGETYGEVHLHSGTDGALLRSFVTSNQSTGFGYGIAGLPDSDGDGFHEVAISAPEFVNGSGTSGVVFIFDGPALGTTADIIDISAANSTIENTSTSGGAYGRILLEANGDLPGQEPLLIVSHDPENITGQAIRVEASTLDATSVVLEEVNEIFPLGDLNADFEVDAADVSELIQEYGLTIEEAQPYDGDINDSGSVAVDDLQQQVANYEVVSDVEPLFPGSGAAALTAGIVDIGCGMSLDGSLSQDCCADVGPTEIGDCDSGDDTGGGGDPGPPGSGGNELPSDNPGGGGEPPETTPLCYFTFSPYSDIAVYGEIVNINTWRQHPGGVYEFEIELGNHLIQSIEEHEGGQIAIQFTATPDVSQGTIAQVLVKYNLGGCDESSATLVFGLKECAVSITDDVNSSFVSFGKDVNLTAFGRPLGGVYSWTVTQGDHLIEPLESSHDFAVLQTQTSVGIIEVQIEYTTPLGCVSTDDISLFINPSFGEDLDADGLSDGDEIVNGTNPAVQDTDGDTLLDGFEVHRSKTGPTLPDTDGDEVDDSLEDLDHDGLNNAGEQMRGTDPLHGDTDNDGLSDGREVELIADPLDADTDDDGLPDGFEEGYGTDLINEDTDGDLQLDGCELAFGTDPHDQASFGVIGQDGIVPSVELSVFGKDLDGDGLPDAVEECVGTNPLNSDSDLDGLSDSFELLNDGLDPTLADSDGDDIFDGSDDHDGDGVSNSVEEHHGFNPNLVDSDGDDIPDNEELVDGSAGIGEETGNILEDFVPQMTSGSRVFHYGAMGYGAAGIGHVAYDFSFGDRTTRILEFDQGYYHLVEPNGVYPFTIEPASWAPHPAWPDYILPFSFHLRLNRHSISYELAHADDPLPPHRVAYPPYPFVPDKNIAHWIMADPEGLFRVHQGDGITRAGSFGGNECDPPSSILECAWSAGKTAYIYVCDPYPNASAAIQQASKKSRLDIDYRTIEGSVTMLPGGTTNIDIELPEYSEYVDWQLWSVKSAGGVSVEFLNDQGEYVPELSVSDLFGNGVRSGTVTIRVGSGNSAASGEPEIAAIRLGSEPVNGPDHIDSRFYDNHYWDDSRAVYASRLVVVGGSVSVEYDQLPTFKVGYVDPGNGGGASALMDPPVQGGGYRLGGSPRGSGAIDQRHGVPESLIVAANTTPEELCTFRVCITDEFGEPIKGVPLAFWFRDQDLELINDEGLYETNDEGYIDVQILAHTPEGADQSTSFELDMLGLLFNQAARDYISGELDSGELANGVDALGADGWERVSHTGHSLRFEQKYRAFDNPFVHGDGWLISVKMGGVNHAEFRVSESAWLIAGMPTYADENGVTPIILSGLIANLLTPDLDAGPQPVVILEDKGYRDNQDAAKSAFAEHWNPAIRDHYATDDWLGTMEANLSVEAGAGSDILPPGWTGEDVTHGAMYASIAISTAPFGDTLDLYKELIWKPLVADESPNWVIAGIAGAGLFLDLGYSVPVLGPTVGLSANVTIGAIKTCVKMLPREVAIALWKMGDNGLDSLILMRTYISRFEPPDGVDAEGHAFAAFEAFANHLLRVHHSALLISTDALTIALDVMVRRGDRFFSDEAFEGAAVFVSRHGGDVAAAKLGEFHDLVRLNNGDLVDIADDSLESVAAAYGKAYHANPGAGALDNVSDSMAAATRTLNPANRTVVEGYIGPGQAIKTMEEFEALRYMRAEDLRPDQVAAMIAIRNGIGDIAIGTPISKATSVSDALNMITMSSGELWGFFSRSADFSGANTSAGVINRFRLDYHGSTFSEGEAFAIIETHMSHSLATKTTIPRSPGYGGASTDPLPFIGDGWAASRDGYLPPEWKLTSPENMDADVTVISFKEADGSPRTMSIGAAGSSDRWMLRADPGSGTGYIWEALP